MKQLNYITRVWLWWNWNPTFVIFCHSTTYIYFWKNFEMHVCFYLFTKYPYFSLFSWNGLRQPSYTCCLCKTLVMPLFVINMFCFIPFLALSGVNIGLVEQYKNIKGIYGSKEKLKSILKLFPYKCVGEHARSTFKIRLGKILTLSWHF